MDNDNTDAAAVDADASEVHLGAAETREPLRCQNFACGYESFEPAKKCPMCGRSMLDRKAFRTLGRVLIGVGVVLAGIGGSLMAFVMPKVNTADKARAGVAGVIFAVLIGAGLLAMIAGAYQAMTGNKNRSLLTALMALFGLLLFVVFAARFIL